MKIYEFSREPEIKTGQEYQKAVGNSCEGTDLDGAAPVNGPTAVKVDQLTILGPGPLGCGTGVHCTGDRHCCLVVCFFVFRDVHHLEIRFCYTRYIKPGKGFSLR